MTGSRPRGGADGTIEGMSAAPRRLIRRIRLAHCARGPKRCARCREADRAVIALLDLDPPRRGTTARRVIDVVVDGETRWLEYDLERVFESEVDARAFAAEHGVDVQLE